MRMHSMVPALAAALLSVPALAQSGATAAEAFRTARSYGERASQLSALAIFFGDSANQSALAACHGKPSETVARDVTLLTHLGVEANLRQRALETEANALQTAYIAGKGEDGALTAFWSAADGSDETFRKAAEVLEGLMRLEVATRGGVARALGDPERSRRCAGFADAARAAGTFDAWLPEQARRIKETDDHLHLRPRRTRSLGSATLGLPSLADEGLPFAETLTTVDGLAVALGAGFGRSRASPRAVLAAGGAQGDETRVFAGVRLQVPVFNPFPPRSGEPSGLVLGGALDLRGQFDATQAIRRCVDAATVLATGVAGTRAPDYGTNNQWESMIAGCIANTHRPFAIGLRAGHALLPTTPAEAPTHTMLVPTRWFLGATGSWGPAEALLGARWTKEAEYVTALRVRAPLSGLIMGVDPVAQVGLELSARAKLQESAIIWDAFTGASLSFRLGRSISLIGTGGWAFEGQYPGLRFNAAIAFDADALL